MLLIEIPARIHIGLLSLSANGSRRNGGLGFAISELSTKIRIEAGEFYEFVDERRGPVSSNDVNAKRELIMQAGVRMGASSAIRIVVESESVGAHTGFGSGTAFALGAIEGLALMNGIKLDRSEIVSLSGRGGASGIGINTYFGGGYVFDLGHRQTDAKFSSSDEVLSKSVPLLGWQGMLPDWEIGICIPHVQGISLIEEQCLFDNVCPISLEDSAIASYHALFGVHASVLERDYERFANAVEAMQDSKWKRAEWDLHGSPLLSVADELRKSGAIAVGLSSVGPALYFFAKDVRKTIIQASLTLGVLVDMMAVQPNNVGRVITSD